MSNLNTTKFESAVYPVSKRDDVEGDLCSCTSQHHACDILYLQDHRRLFQSLLRSLHDKQSSFPGDLSNMLTDVANFNHHDIKDMKLGVRLRST